MCGISGIINFDGEPVQEKQITAMNRIIKHRGPDDDGYFLDKNIGLGSVRLRIFDLSSHGHMPMFSEDGNEIIVYNGEIYNYIELKDQLKHKYSFKTGTDTEVLIAAYRVWGTECLNYFNGMFSFVLYDLRNKKFFLARDRFGIKPFYYYLTGKGIIFSSEISPILYLTNEVEANDEMIYDFLVFNRTNHSENTFFKGIKKLQHSHYMIIEGSAVKINRWYDLKEKVQRTFVSPDEFKDLLVSSIGLRLRSDVPVGACLSGGLDSSTIVSVILDKFKEHNLNTFSAVYKKGATGDESLYINEYKNLVDLQHFIKPTSESFLNDMDFFIRAQEEPIPGTSVYAEYKVMEDASKFVKVVLNGQGADELLAGYDYFFGFYFKEILLKFNILKFLNEATHYIAKHHSMYSIGAAGFLLLPSKLQTEYKLKNNMALADDFARLYGSNKRITETLYSSKTLHNSLLDHFEYKLEHLLLWGDRNSMWFSVEVRFPFLDYRLVEKCLALANDQIIKRGITKQILRESMKGVLPEKIRMRKDKVGFETPENEWFREEKFRDLIYNILDQKKFAYRGYIDSMQAKRMYCKHLDRKVNISKMIWKWVNLELWFNKFIDHAEHMEI